MKRFLPATLIGLSALCMGVALGQTVAVPVPRPLPPHPVPFKAKNTTICTQLCDAANPQGCPSQACFDVLCNRMGGCQANCEGGCSSGCYCFATAVSCVCTGTGGMAPGGAP